MLNSLVDKIFLATTVGDNDRQEYVINHLHEHNITAQYIISPYYKMMNPEISVRDSTDHEGFSRTSLSLLSAHMSIMKSSLLNNYTSICLLEDDVFFNTGWEDDFKIFLHNVPNDWEILNVGYTPYHDNHSVKIPINDKVYSPLRHHYSTHCVIINNPKIFEEYIDISHDTSYSLPVDYIFNILYNKYKSYCPVDKFIYQLSERSGQTKLNDIGPLYFTSSIR